VAFIPLKNTQFLGNDACGLLGRCTREVHGGAKMHPVGGRGEVAKNSLLLCDRRSQKIAKSGRSE